MNVGSFIAERYEIIEKIGAGGMSDVYKAKDQILGRFVAVKVLKQEFTEDLNFVGKFHAEAQSAASLEHPNIVNIYDVGSEEHLHYIVMEYVEGITLKTYVEKKGQLNYKEAISIAIQVGRGIEAAHDKGIVHRDIKPQNIIISTQGKVKVTDFGIAKAATANTIHSDVMGSVHYSSPEQARNGFIDGKSDIYSLGVVMYEMVTGRVPFDGDTTVAIAIQHLQEEMVSPSAYAPELPISLEKIILKCTQKSPDRRYATIVDLLADLKNALMNPADDFVVLESSNVAGKTRVIGQEEVSRIKEQTAGVAAGAAVGAAASQAAADKVAKNVTYQAPETEVEEDDDEDEGGFLNPKMEKVVTVLGIITALIILAIIIYLVGSMAGIFSGGKGKDKPEDNTPAIEEKVDDEDDEQVEMINIVGKDYDAAKLELKNLGLGIFVSRMEENSDIPENQIISQDIEVGKKVDPNTTVNVVISQGVGMVAVPDVKGYKDTAAIGMLTDAGFEYIREYQSSDTVPEGDVIEQTPASGTSAVPGSTVTIIVSQGKESVQVPDVSNYSQSEAQKMLEAAKLVVGTVTTEFSDTVPEGNVISQSVVAFKTVYAGTAVDLVVSSGREETTYYFKANITLPNDDTVVAANMSLHDSEGNVIEEWVGVDVSEFPYAIRVDGITSETGVLYIEWIMEDMEGNISTSTQEVTQQFSMTE